MRNQYEWNAVAAAFTQVCRLVDRQERIYISKLGLNQVSMGYFKQAVTHSFTKDKHGFDLQRIFIIDPETNLWHRNTSPNRNPTDESLINLIIQAMSYIGKEKRNANKTVPVKEEINLSSFTTEQLITELKQRLNCSVCLQF